MIKSLIGQRIRMMRNRAGYSQESFSRVCGLDRTYIAGVELGRRNISIENLNKIAEALNLTLAELCDISVPADRTILLTVNGESFILESKTELSADVKDYIEVLCRTAYDEDSDFILELNKEQPEITLHDMTAFEIAELAGRIIKEKTGIDTVFKGIDLEVQITE